MNTQQVNIRDPFILPHDGVYYLYGTRSATAWGAGDGFDCYTSADLERWEGPIEIFRRPEGFFADREYWAPECIHYQGAFYHYPDTKFEEHPVFAELLSADGRLTLK